MRWTHDKWALLDELDAKGLSDAEIGRIMGTSRDAVYTARRDSHRRGSTYNLVVWDAEKDRQIVQGRADRKSWNQIGKEMGLSYHTVMRRGETVLGLPHFLPPRETPPPSRQPSVDRGPLPAGHPVSWRLLLSLTPSLPPDTPYRAELPLCLRTREEPAQEWRAAA